MVKYRDDDRDIISQKKYQPPSFKMTHPYNILPLLFKIYRISPLYDIVCIGVSTPPLKKTTAPFFSKLLLKSATCPSPLFRQFPPLYFIFFVHHPLKLRFPVTPILLKCFILNPQSIFQK